MLSLSLSKLSPATERVKVQSRTARKHYGTEIMSRYDSAKHTKASSFWDEYDGESKGRSFPSFNYFFEAVL